VSAFELLEDGEVVGEWRLSSLATRDVPVPDGYRPIRLSSLRISDAEGVARAAMCILMGESY
jgi:hypothetical protein